MTSTARLHLSQLLVKQADEMNPTTAAVLGALPGGMFTTGIHGGFQGGSIGQAGRSGGRTLGEAMGGSVAGGAVGGGLALLVARLLKLPKFKAPDGGFTNAGQFRNAVEQVRPRLKLLGRSIGVGGLVGGSAGGAHGAYAAAKNHNAREHPGILERLKSQVHG